MNEVGTAIPLHRSGAVIRIHSATIGLHFTADFL
jgi:hypothetical protein